MQNIGKISNIGCHIGKENLKFLKARNYIIKYLQNEKIYTFTDFDFFITFVYLFTFTRKNVKRE